MENTLVMPKKYEAKEEKFMYANTIYLRLYVLYTTNS